jgi:hypothetical protein
VRERRAREDAPRLVDEHAFAARRADVDTEGAAVGHRILLDRDVGLIELVHSKRNRFHDQPRESARL